MKYLIVIFFLMGISSVIVLYFFRSEDPIKVNDVALQVNGQFTTEKQIEALIKTHGYHGEGRSGQMDALVTRQLMIQEAVRLGIDKEEAFRMALKLYYEQSLIKVLTDRQLAQAKVDITASDIDRYLAGSGKKYTFTETPIESGRLITAKGVQHTVIFDDLSESLRLLLSSIKPGESVSKFDTGTEISHIRLDKVEESENVKPVIYDRERLAVMLNNYYRSREVDRWIRALHEKASIIISDKEKIND